MDKKTEFWNSMIRAAEAEPKFVESVRGASGLIHPVVALGTDDHRKRLIVISGESDPRVTAMAQADLQAAMPTIKVLVARPNPINLGAVARIVSGALNGTTIQLGEREQRWLQQGEEAVREQAGKFLSIYGDEIGQYVFLPAQFALVNRVALWQELIKQLSLVEIQSNPENNQKKVNGKKRRSTKRHKQDNGFSLPTGLGLSSLMALDPAALDRQYGVCSIPLYEFSQAEVDVLHSGRDREYVSVILRRHDILQYFFPPADELAVGLVELATRPATDIASELSKVPDLGHPFGKFEIIDSHFGNINMIDVVDTLKDKGFLVEGEIGMELGKDGKTLRTTARFRPKEGLLQKLSRIFSFSVELNLKDLFKP